MLAVDLLAWTQTILLHDHPALARAEPKTLRYRLLHVAARLIRGGRRLRLRLDRHWPWAAAPRRRLRPLRRPAATRPLNHSPDPTTGAGEPGDPGRATGHDPHRHRHQTRSTTGAEITRE